MQVQENLIRVPSRYPCILRCYVRLDQDWEDNDEEYDVDNHENEDRKMKEEKDFVSLSTDEANFMSNQRIQIRIWRLWGLKNNEEHCK